MATKQNTGVVDGSGNPVLDGSGNPIMSGRFPDEDEITARGRARNAAMFKSFANRLTGKKEEAKKPAPAFSPPTRPGQETSGSKPAASKPVASKAKPAAKAKPAIVTKEQLAKSGFTNLRDYLNDQKKLKRRDGKAPEKAKPAAKASEDNRPKASGAMIQSMDTDMMRNASRSAAKQAGRDRKFPKASGATIQSMDTDMMRNVSRSAAKRRSDERKATEKRQIDENTALTKRSVAARVGRAESVAENARKARQNNSIQDSASGYKKGGKVCMASKRADGIAVKGKTRGKVY